jgi:Holliday junction resolvase RusA-like endonuclease
MTPLELRFVVEGPPVPYQRPGYDPVRRIRYTEPRSEKYMRAVRGEARAASLRELVDGKLRPRRDRWPAEDDCARSAYRRRGVRAPDCECDWCSRRYALERRARDLDNIEKAILDGCTGALYRDDRQAYVERKRPLINPERPRVEVIVRVTGPWQLELMEKSA